MDEQSSNCCELEEYCHNPFRIRG